MQPRGIILCYLRKISFASSPSARTLGRISRFEFSGSAWSKELGKIVKQRGVTDGLAAAKLLDFMLRRSCEMRGVLGKLQTSAWVKVIW